jgi:lysozyme family protein
MNNLTEASMEKSTFLGRLIDALIDREGGYVDHPNDLGGPTMFGITEDVARLHGHEGSMVELSRRIAVIIYEEQYWFGPRFDQVGAMSELVAEELLDTGVNMGLRYATEFLQRSLNALNAQERTYADLMVDGLIGNNTLVALKKYLAHRGSEGQQVLLKALNCLQGARYIELSQAREKNEAFVYGWLRTRVVLSHEYN